MASTKSVVLTCVMRPANALKLDGPQNLLDALVSATGNGTSHHDLEAALIQALMREAQTVR